MFKFKNKRDRAVGMIALVAVFSSATLAGAVYAVDWASSSLSSNLVESLQPPAPEDVIEPTLITVTSVNSPAQKFLGLMKEYEPTAAKKASTRDAGTASTPVSWVCSQMKFSPEPTSGVQVFLDGRSSVTIQAFGAGQAVKAVTDYQGGIRKCVQKDGSAGITSLSPSTIDAQGFSYNVSRGADSSNRGSVITWIRGDAMMSVYSQSLADAKALALEYDKYALSQLEETKCLSVTAKPTDYVRSPFYGEDRYKGWNKGRSVDMPSASTGITPGIRSTSGDMVGKGTIIGKPRDFKSPEDRIIPTVSGYATASKPLAPLLDGMEDSLPEKLTKPVIDFSLSKPVAPKTTVTIPERVEDAKGPGCGWQWAGQLPPEFDASEEKANADKKELETKTSLIKSYVSYMTSYSEWFNSMARYNILAQRYNTSVAEYNEIAEGWESLNSERQQYRSALDSYLELADAFEKFESNLAAAEEKYSADIDVCMSTVVGAPTPEPTDDPTGEPTDDPTGDSGNTGDEGGLNPTPEPTEPAEPVYPTREDCEESVAKPSILTDAKPVEPTPPPLPSVPLPESWTDVPR